MSRTRINAPSAACAGLTVLVLWIATGCDASKSCTAMGAIEGANVVVDAGLVPASEPITISACVDDACGTQSYSSRPVSDAATSLFVAVTPVRRNAKVKVSVKIASATTQLFSGSTTTATIKNQPNGPGCSPTVWNVRVTAEADGKLAG